MRFQLTWFTISLNIAVTHLHQIELNTYSVEPVVDKMFEIFTHADLSHEFVLVAVHASQLADMSKHVLQSVGQLKGIYVVQSVLHVWINDQLGQPQDLSAQMESYNI